MRYQRLILSVVTVFACVAAAASEPAPERIRFNQLGFLPDGPKRAIVVDAATQPLAWGLLDANGKEVAAGHTVVFGINEGSGEHVHQLDFSDVRARGAGFRLVVGDASSRPFAIEPHIFDGLKRNALAYFYHNRSGIPIEAKYVGEKWARPAGHVDEIVGCFDKKDARGVQWPGCDYTLDARRGWYDAGDHGKYVVNAGISVWTLLNYYERAQRSRGSAPMPFADGEAAIPENGNGINDLLDEVRWELEFLLGMQAPEGARIKMPSAAGASDFVEIDASGLAHHKVHGEQWTAMPSAPHEDRAPRYAHPPSTTATLNLAANAAQCARVWRALDASFAERCLRAAKRAYAAALRHPNLMPFGAFTGGGAYGDRDASDEFYWAAAELFVTTGEETYAQALRSSPHFLAAPTADGAGEISWAQVRTLGTITLLTVPNRLGEDALARARANLIAAADVYAGEATRQGYALPYASLQYQWGSNSIVLNRAIVLAHAYDLTGKSLYRDRVVDALDYVLGRNPLDRSFVSGHGVRAMRNPHHRFWAHQLDPKYPPPPPGALSGGPNSTNMADPIAQGLRGKCIAQTCWQDHVEAYALNEVAINWNAPLVWVAAFVAGL
jgi:Glycosyl hydrolase family 9./N-terminal ig-like domain of cellulase.